MYTPHTVTVYNIVQETNPDTLEDTEKAYITVLRGVMLQASKAANVRESGLEGADAVNLYIPFSVEAVDGVTGKPKTYARPQAFNRAPDKGALWTLSYNGNGGNTVFVKGEYVEGKVSIVLEHDDCYNVTKVDEKDFGSADMQHWEVGGA